MIPIITPASSPHAIFPDMFQNRCHHVRGIGTGTSIRSCSCRTIVLVAVVSVISTVTISDFYCGLFRKS